MKQPWVTVVIPFRNPGIFLVQACRSLEQQSIKAWQALLVNDGSDDLSLRFAEERCLADSRFKLLHVNETNHAPGPWMARNLGLTTAQTTLVAFLDADDLWHPDKLARQLPLHQDAPPLISVCTYHRFKSGHLQVMETRTPPSALTFTSLLRGNCIPLSSVVADRKMLVNAGGFRAEHHEDYGLWLRLFASANPPTYRCLEEPLMAYRLHSQSISAKRHQSLAAVNQLFRQHLPSRTARWGALARWGVERLRPNASSNKQNSSQNLVVQTKILPDAYRSLIRD